MRRSDLSYFRQNKIKTIMFVNVVFILYSLVGGFAIANADHSMPAASASMSQSIRDVDLDTEVYSTGTSISASRCSQVNLGSIVLTDKKVGDGDCLSDSNGLEFKVKTGVEHTQHKVTYSTVDGLKYEAPRTKVSTDISAGYKHEISRVSGNLEDWTGWEWAASDYHAFLDATAGADAGFSCSASRDHGKNKNSGECTFGLFLDASIAVIKIHDGGEIDAFFENAGLGFINANVALVVGEVGADAKVGFILNSDGIFIGGKVGAEAYLVKVEGGGELELFSIFGKTAVVCVDGRAGVGAEASAGAYYEDGRVETELGVAWGLGGAVGLCFGLVD